MKKILIIGDSSALSRVEVFFNKTYYSLIKSLNKSYIESSSKTNITSYEINLNLDAFMLYGYNPDVVILNYGIVDVYPRPYPNKIYKLLACIGLLKYIDLIFKKTKLYYRIGDFLKFQEVNIKNFEIYTESIIKKLLLNNVKKIIIIGIIRPYKVLLKSNIADDEIVKYNNIYKKFAEKYSEVEYIDIYNDSTEDFTIWDGYHYSEKASQYLAGKIEKLVLND